jgi:hypothetical protein
VESAGKLKKGNVVEGSRKFYPVGLVAKDQVMVRFAPECFSTYQVSRARPTRLPRG